MNWPTWDAYFFIFLALLSSAKADLRLKRKRTKYVCKTSIQCYYSPWPRGPNRPNLIGPRQSNLNDWSPAEWMIGNVVKTNMVVMAFIIVANTLHNPNDMESGLFVRSCGIRGGWQRNFQRKHVEWGKTCYFRTTFLICGSLYAQQHSLFIIFSLVFSFSFMVRMGLYERIFSHHRYRLQSCPTFWRDINANHSNANILRFKSNASE